MNSADVHLHQVNYNGTFSSSSYGNSATILRVDNSSDPRGIPSTPLSDVMVLHDGCIISTMDHTASGIMKSMISPSSIHVDGDTLGKSHNVMLGTFMSQSSSLRSCSRIHPTVDISNGSSCSISSAPSFGKSFQVDQHSLQRSDKGAHGSTESMPPRPDSTRKCRLNAPPSCSSLKVRKEKLGDRIASLQQLVAPYGKTDTTTVLTEAIGCIKYLQDQVQALSVPYMKQKHYARANNTAKKQGGFHAEKEDLKSVGLCLVPLSCMSYVENAGGYAGAVWPPFRTGT